MSESSQPASTLFEKVWQRHVVREETAATPAILYIDLQLLHEVTSPQAFDELKRRGLKVRRPECCLATIDHSTPTTPPDSQGVRHYNTPEAKAQVDLLQVNCAAQGIPLHGWDSPNRGIVHVMGPELGATQPGMTIVCGDSHTATHGAFGALAFGIGTTEVGHVLATQCLLQSKPETLGIRIDGELQPGVTAKDVILHVIGAIGVDGGTGSVIEYHGSTVRAMSMESRMTLCNMSIECGARAGMVAPDETTFAYLEGRLMSPQGEKWAAAVADWKTLVSDPGAHYDRLVRIDASRIEPNVTWGTNPGMVMAVDDAIPSTDSPANREALEYMQLEAGARLAGEKVDVVFIGSCTNSRMTDLREAAALMKNRRVAAGTRVLVVPGSEATRREAEAEGLDRIFLQAGAEWREPGCSMCLAMNGDSANPGDLVVSTSNRNFKGRQGRGVRTVLASPLTAAASAVTGRVTNPRELMETGT
ncbi:MAG: 3-isopropylmalate dehydratase large subunit [Xanthomonadales bacterium]|nr:3-isopropylmalate dehydratase large subunit [Gammaproteobacteria bacterium]MBT8053465.1 3-isopropylmalate dehydratase large subunit [Gammaproteobacteria bacterium]NND55833.1 3-isopropylmalate dehydratase large subunit [Xanthomonadales bacterium]NNK50947.1 3-isopropylmalate dehydratase large subunit [Xanthomonadales bacterium]